MRRNITTITLSSFGLPLILRAGVSRLFLIRFFNSLAMTIAATIIKSW